MGRMRKRDGRNEEESYREEGRKVK